MVDLAGVDAARHSHLGPQQLQFRERLTQEIMTHTWLRPRAMAGMLNENAALRPGLAEKTGRDKALTRPSCADADGREKLEYTLRQQAHLRAQPLRA